MNKNYLNKVIDKLVDETILDFIILKIYLPFSGGLVAENGIFLSAGHFSNHSHLFNGFYNHCRTIYGLTEEEIEYSWDKYRHIIIDKIFQSTPLNESTRNKFLDKIIAQLVNETNIDYGRERVFAPFISTLPAPFFTFSQLPLLSTFAIHCNTIYGITYHEIDYIWDQYKSIIEDKIENKIS